MLRKEVLSFTVADKVMGWDVTVGYGLSRYGYLDRGPTGACIPFGGAPALQAFCSLDNTMGIGTEINAYIGASLTGAIRREDWPNWYTMSELLGMNIFKPDDLGSTIRVFYDPSYDEGGNDLDGEHSGGEF